MVAALPTRRVATTSWWPSPGAPAKASVSSFVESLGLRPVDTGDLMMAANPRFGETQARNRRHLNRSLGTIRGDQMATDSKI
jgi:predicted dinucleotide-binding enzyme